MTRHTMDAHDAYDGQVSEARGTLRRRGVIAVAAAVVAGLAMRDVTNAPTVAAAFNLQGDTSNISNSGTTINGAPTISFFGITFGGNVLSVNYTGTTFLGTGISGTTAAPSGSGISGSLQSTATNGIGVNGDGSNGGTGSIGVQGTGGLIGVQGGSTTGYGVVARAGTNSVAALYGSSTSLNIPAFAAYNAVAGGLAGSFNGKVYINGDYVATGSKSAAVPHPDGTHRLLYCMESPEAWFEDFGTGTITGGKAEVKLDPDFAAVVDTKELHVFLTPHDETHHLAVKGRTGGSFSVAAGAAGEAITRGAKASDLSGTFTWRVVAKRKDVAAPRLAKFDLPKPVLPPPEPPATPKRPAPPKQ